MGYLTGKQNMSLSRLRANKDGTHSYAVFLSMTDQDKLKGDKLSLEQKVHKHL